MTIYPRIWLTLVVVIYFIMWLMYLESYNPMGSNQLGMGIIFRLKFDVIDQRSNRYSMTS